MRRRFFWSILAVSALALLIVAVGSTLVARANARERLTNALAERAVVLGEAMVSDRVSDLAPERLADRLQQQGVAMLARQDRTLADGVELRIGLLADELTFSDPGAGEVAWDIAALRRGDDSTVQYRTPDGRVVAVAHPVRLSPDVSLVVALATRQDPLALGPIVRDLRIPLLVAAALAAVAARALSRWLSRRLERVSDAAEALAAGDTSARAETEGADEVADLAKAFNRMATQLESAADRERRFLMDVSHELRTPLTTIGGYAEVLGASADTETARVGTIIERESDRLRRLIEDVMILARLEARQFTVRQELVDLGAHVAEVVRGFEPAASAADVHLDVTAGATGAVMIDPDRVAQIVANLVSNAIRHTPAQGTVEVTVETSTTAAEIVVSDNGAGVDPADLPHLFERFRTGRTHQRPEGSGLGLAIVRQLVDLLGGDVAAALRPTGGLAMRVRLPI